MEPGRLSSSGGRAGLVLQKGWTACVGLCVARRDATARENAVNQPSIVVAHGRNGLLTDPSPDTRERSCNCERQPGIPERSLKIRVWTTRSNPAIGFQWLIHSECSEVRPHSSSAREPHGTCLERSRSRHRMTWRPRSLLRHAPIRPVPVLISWPRPVMAAGIAWRPGNRRDGANCASWVRACIRWGRPHTPTDAPRDAAARVRRQARAKEGVP